MFPVQAAAIIQVDFPHGYRRHRRIVYYNKGLKWEQIQKPI